MKPAKYKIAFSFLVVHNGVSTEIIRGHPPWRHTTDESYFVDECNRSSTLAGGRASTNIGRHLLDNIFISSEMGFDSGEKVLCTFLCSVICPAMVGFNSVIKREWGIGPEVGRLFKLKFLSDTKLRDVLQPLAETLSPGDTGKDTHSMQRLLWRHSQHLQFSPSGSILVEAIVDPNWIR